MQRLSVFVGFVFIYAIQAHQVFGERSVNISQKNVVLIGANYYSP
jgi:hypothetical protein